MKVLYLLHSTLPKSGATKAILTLVRQLEKQGVVPIFVVPDKKGIYSTLIASGHDTYCIPFKLSIYPNQKSISDKLTYYPKLVCRIAINIYALTRMVKLAKLLHPDIIHTNTSVVSLGRLAAKRVHIPHIQHIREYAEYGNRDFSMHYFPSWKYIHRALKSDNSCNICITKDIQKHHELNDADNSVVIYDGVHDKVSVLPDKKKESFFLYAGRIEHIKGLDILLRAYNSYISKVDNPLHLYVAGDNSDSFYFQQIDNYIKAHHLSGYIDFMGDISNLGEVMQKANALIIPSRSEGFGFCMPEAMFNGCLCIGYYIAGTKEQIDNGRAYTEKNIAIPYSTSEELADILLTVHNSHPDQWNEMKECAFKTVNALYTYEKSAEAILEIYYKLTKRL